MEACWHLLQTGWPAARLPALPPWPAFKTQGVVGQHLGGRGVGAQAGLFHNHGEALCSPRYPAQHKKRRVAGTLTSHTADDLTLLRERVRGLSPNARSNLLPNVDGAK
jgi:hypothetical protein